MSDTRRGKQIVMAVGNQPWWEVQDPASGQSSGRSAYSTAGPLQTVCAWCNRIQSAEGLWSRAKNSRHAGAEVKLSHGICPECAENSLDEYRRGTFAVGSVPRFA
jgi:hypothetical protein